MKVINKYIVSRKYYDEACKYYQEANARLVAENEEHRLKFKKIIACAATLKSALNDYDDICEQISKITGVDFKLTEVAYRLGRILDADEMF